MHMGCKLGVEEGEGWDCRTAELVEGADRLGMLKDVGLLVEGVVLTLVVGATQLDHRHHLYKKKVSVKKCHLCSYFHFLLDFQSHGI
jgi:hypothetical protein